MQENVRRKIIERAFENNDPLVNRAPPIQEEDLKRICYNLFSVNSKKSLEDRCLFALQWQLCGRAMKNAHLSFESIKFNHSLRCLETKLLSRETGDLNELSLFIHKDDWKACVYHSLASYLVVSEPTGEYILKRFL
jgi:hypothetical protein